TGVSTIIPIRAAVTYGRRETTVLFLLTLAITLFFHYGRSIPRWLLAGGLLFAMVLIPATEQYRRLAKFGPLEAIRQIDFLNPIKAYDLDNTVSEARNGMMLIAASRTTESYRYGKDYWNEIVFRFVPAQFVGTEVKNELMV